MTKPLKSFELAITRSAYETVYLNVKAKTEDDAVDRIEKLLNRAKRVTLDDVTKLRGVKVVDSDCNGDEESTWELIW
jgi:hypothetical protein